MRQTIFEVHNDALGEFSLNIVRYGEYCELSRHLHLFIEFCEFLVGSEG